jgi:2-amino-4-hydroxy-6-hydroxymethyldihydropteridine diphosphokinase
MGPPEQPDYINAAALLETRLSPLQLLDELQSLENHHERVRQEHWGPRTLDLDLLLYGNLEMTHPRLTLPHPGMGERCFVLVPMAEIAPPSLRIPGLNSLDELVAKVDRADLHRLPQATLKA